MHAQPHRNRTALAGTAILLSLAVLTLSLSHYGARDLLASPGLLAAGAFRLFEVGFRAAPALTIGIVLAGVLPVLSALVRLSKPLTRSKNATRRYKPGRGDDYATGVEETPRVSRCHPFIEIENGRGQRCAILRDMLRIGREDDNDIRIQSRYVHRYHAAIHREDHDDWLITDLTGVESNGLIVNGKRCCEARLSDGDLIQLGPGKLRFRAPAW